MARILWRTQVQVNASFEKRNRASSSAIHHYCLLGNDSLWRSVSLLIRPVITTFAHVSLPVVHADRRVNMRKSQASASKIFRLTFAYFRHSTEVEALRMLQTGRPKERRAPQNECVSPAAASPGSSCMRIWYYGGDLVRSDETPMRLTWDISFSADEISAEIGRDFMRLDETFADATTPAAAETSQPIAFASPTLRGQGNLRKSLGNALEKPGLRISIAR